jgi:hypothetical protein
LGLGESHGCASIILPDDCKRRQAWRLRVMRLPGRCRSSDGGYTPPK